VSSHPISWLLNAYVIVIFVRIVLSWFPIQPDSPMATVYRFVYALTEPVLGPVRRVVPGIGFGGMGLDLSPMIVIFGLYLIVIPLVQRAGL
jgi:YggT family protein